ncbi:vWA domain-containing protein [Sinimarinibacterium flocculans]|uniref:Ca-activated chloride channel family protein n=1 Tax=Sinimarinibacterium flocculans TaxID=985250 RepID=A0A318EHB5_9GAMM|nr:VWA domain-containing protein [Sinimarinibacterium flocculans]PXV70179.1 Ca-activated chloride channel family protein [Sinimarinibacterium flocculans]
MSRIQWISVVGMAALVAACAQPEREAPSRMPVEEGRVAELAELGDAAGKQEAARELIADRMAMSPQTAGKQHQAPTRSAIAPAPMPPVHRPAPVSPEERERYAAFDDAGVLCVAESPVSTFSVDVDTGAYSNVRRWLRNGRLPPQDAVRVEEFINYFDYAYAPPRDRSTPFATHVEIAPTPWNAKTHLLRVALQGWRPQGELPPSNLVFLIDVSGSMHSADKLPLVQSSLKLLVQQLSARDRISLVVYAGHSGVVLEPTPGDRKARIAAVIDGLTAGGSTAGAAGIELAYSMARQGFIEGGINRVLLATDGDFNVGVTDFEQLKDLVERERASGVALSTLGFGTGNYNEHLMEQLADVGNGNYSYIDDLAEGRRVLVQARAATLQTIAKDVKIQIEFNPAVVAEYRLIGYENRALAREDFANDRVDAGEIGAGHNVTALYEIALVGSGGERIEALRYGGAKPAGTADEIAHLRLRYKAPDGDSSKLIERPIRRSQITRALAASSEDFRFAAAVAGFGQLLRGGRYTEAWTWDDALALARGARGVDAQGWRGEFVQLVQLAQSLQPQPAQQVGHAGEACELGSGCD